VTVTGETGLPVVELFDSDEGLILGVVSATPPQTQATPEQPAAQTEENQEPIELVVTATRTETPIQNVPRSITVIDREQIAAQASTSRNLIEILGKTVPGLAPPAQGASNFGLTLRMGFPNRQPEMRRGICEQLTRRRLNELK